jgi:peptidoglycan/xylan/chitin deacetylase (PgdA/CDA1 family)
MRVVTTSWDDGDPSDIKIADLLRSRNMAGTFYVPIQGYRGRETVSPSDLRSLASEGFEIGSHSVSHVSLSNLSRNQITHEVRDCKQILEQAVGQSIQVFCYPNGRFDRRVVREIRSAGYKGARTTRMLSSATRFRRFEMPTTIQAYPHSTIGYVKNLVRAGNISSLCTYASCLRKLHSWVDLGMYLFDDVMKYGGIWHLYGHSWEIENLGLWKQLCVVLDYVCKRRDVVYATNGQLVSTIRSQSQANESTSYYTHRTPQQNMCELPGNKRGTHAQWIELF